MTSLIARYKSKDRKLRQGHAWAAHDGISRLAVIPKAQVQACMFLNMLYCCKFVAWVKCCGQGSKVGVGGAPEHQNPTGEMSAGGRRTA
jgi:hypothetical protein